MATLFKRDNGVYYVVQLVRRRRKWRSLRTCDELEARQLFEPIRREEEKKTCYYLSDYCEDFEKRARVHLSNGTIEIYKSSVKNFVRVCGDLPITKVTTLDVESFKEMRIREVKPVTLNIELRTLRALFNDALRLKLINENPFKNVKLARTLNEEAAHLDEEDFHKLILAIDDIEFRNIVVFATFTMMRRSEIVNLLWSDVNIDRKIIIVRNHDNFRVKGGRPRVIPMCGWVYNFLFRAQRTSSHVFADSLRRPLQPDSITSRFKRYAKKAKMNLPAASSGVSS
jgi:integrase